jgi:3-hydroxy acid dehydrogenase/malonic semialdehyde reductase
VTNVEPGMVGGTDFSKVRFDGDQAKADKVYEGTTPLTADDVAESVHWAASQPKHVNINVIELMPVVQSFSALQIYRES